MEITPAKSSRYYFKIHPRRSKLLKNGFAIQEIIKTTRSLLHYKNFTKKIHSSNAKNHTNVLPSTTSHKSKLKLTDFFIIKKCTPSFKLYRHYTWNTNNFTETCLQNFRKTVLISRTILLRCCKTLADHLRHLVPSYLRH